MRVWRVIELDYGYLLETSNLEKKPGGTMTQVTGVQVALRNEDEVIRALGTTFTMIKQARAKDKEQAVALTGGAKTTDASITTPDTTTDEE